MTNGFKNTVTTSGQLDELYAAPQSKALIKELDHLTDNYRAFVEKSPFVVLATSGPSGLDVSPRGDPSGFVRVLDDRTLALPDRRGNNRLDSLRNIVEDPRVSLLFMIPGVGETLRVKGTAQIVLDENLCQSFEIKGKAPVSVLVISIDKVYFQCQKALARSKLWDPDARIDRSELPTAGQILQALDQEFDGGTYDREYPEYMKKTIY